MKFLLADKNWYANWGLTIFGLIDCYARDTELCHLDHSEVVCSSLSVEYEEVISKGLVGVVCMEVVGEDCYSNFLGFYICWKT